MDSKIVWIIIKKLKKTWVRVLLFALLAILTAVLSQWVGYFFPADWALKIGADSVGNVLNILASSMLAVTTFSLGIAVSAFSAAASNATPRATALLQEDSTAQNILAIFLGAFLFSLVGIIAMEAGYYSDNGLVILFAATSFVLALVIWALLKWINHLMTFGRMADTLDRVENITHKVLKKHVQNPYLGAKPYQGEPPEETKPCFSLKTGFVVHIDVGSLQSIAEQHEIQVWVTAVTGVFVHEAQALLHFSEPKKDQTALLEDLQSAFIIETDRTYDQDFRFGLVVLTEIASRALSPGINDAGTAKSVLVRLVRILSSWKDHPALTVTRARVFLPELVEEAFLRDTFHPIARDGANLLEIHIRLQKALQALSQVNSEAFGEATLKLSLEYENLAHENLTPAELEVFKQR